VWCGCVFGVGGTEVEASEKSESQLFIQMLLCCPNALFTCLVSRLARYDLVALSVLAKHGLQIRHDDIGSLVCCEMAALGVKVSTSLSSISHKHTLTLSLSLSCTTGPTTSSAQHSLLHQLSKLTQRLPPTPRHNRNFPRKMRKPQLHLPNPLARPLPIRHLIRWIMSRLVVDPYMRIRPRGTEPVNTQPRANLVVGPRIIICPVDQFLVDPREQRDGTVCEGVG
jgi:hypothetical protein